MFKFIPFERSGLAAEEWDIFVNGSDNGTIFHTRKFLSYHPKSRFKDASIVVLKNDKLFSVLPAVEVEREEKKMFSSHSGASYGGFVYNIDLNLKDAFELVEGLLNYSGSSKYDRIQITPPPIIYESKYSNYIDFALVKNGFNYLKRDISSVVQLDIEAGQLLSTYRAEARTAVNKSIKKGVLIKECEEFDDYFKILKKNLKLRHDVTPTHTVEELKKLKKMFPEEIRLWGAFLDKKLIAGVCNFNANPKVVLAFYISHDEDYQEYRAVNLLFYEIMKKYQEEGFRFLDFGIFTVNMDPNWGLARFKENFGARGIFRDTLYKDL